MSPLSERDLAFSERIDGWMSPDELYAIYDMARQMKTVVEIGAWKGRTTSVLCTACKEGHVIAVDHFQGSASEMNTFEEVRRADIFRQFMENTKQCSNLSILRMDSIKAGLLFKPKSIDMVFIDGDHEYRAFRKDLEVWSDVARVLIAGHDFGNHPGIEEALKDLGMKYTNPVGQIWEVRL